MGFSNGFGNKAGKNTANALFNLLGIDFSDRKRVDLEVRKHEAASEKIKIQQKEMLNLIDAAVLDNVDSVATISFSNDPETLCDQISELVVQLETNGWGDTSDGEAGKENKVRNKYTDAVLSKVKAGVKKLERIDPTNPYIDDFQTAMRKSRWRKFFGKYKTWLIFFGVLLMICFMGLIVDTEFRKAVLPILIPLCVAIIAFVVWIKIKRNKARKLRAEARSAMLNNTKAQPAQTMNEIPQMMNFSGTESPKRRNTVPETTSNIEDHIKKIEEKYYILWGKYGHLNEIMNRGFAACKINKQSDILIVGFNPSYPPNSPRGNHFYPFPDTKTGFWGRVNDMLIADKINLKPRATYIDMFAFRESDQNVALNQIVCNNETFDYVVEQVTLIQECIENVIKPRFIVIKNKAAWAFWGKEIQFTWMGYDFKHIEDTPYGELCVIEGFRNDNDRINKHLTSSALSGTYVLFTTHTAQSYPTPSFIEQYID